MQPVVLTHVCKWTRYFEWEAPTMVHVCQDADVAYVVWVMLQTLQRLDAGGSHDCGRAQQEGWAESWKESWSRSLVPLQDRILFSQVVEVEIPWKRRSTKPTQEQIRRHNSGNQTHHHARMRYDLSSDRLTKTWTTHRNASCLDTNLYCFIVN